MESSTEELFRNSGGEINTDWTIEALSTSRNLGDECNNTHVQPNGEHHYLGTPWSSVKEARKDTIFILGWAADGFPRYYKWAYENSFVASSKVLPMISSYRIRKEERPGDGIRAPNGTYEIHTLEILHYVEGLGILDRTKGREGITPGFPMGT